MYEKEIYVVLVERKTDIRPTFFGVYAIDELSDAFSDIGDDPTIDLLTVERAAITVTDGDIEEWRGE